MTTFPNAMPAILTPFTEAGKLDPTGHQHNVGQLVAEGASGFVVAGSTGEGPYLEPGERRELVQATRAAAPNAFVMCGVNAESVRQAAAQIEEFATSGADAALVATPGSLVRGEDASVEFFYEQIADTSPLPIFLYTVPKVTGYILPTSSIAALASHANIVGVKDSGGDPTRLADIGDAISAGFVVYAGASRALRESHLNGAHGAITASANYALALVTKAASGDQTSQEQLTEITGIIERHGVPGTKFAARLTGRSTGTVRSPLAEVTDLAAAEIRSALEMAQR